MPMPVHAVRSAVASLSGAFVDLLAAFLFMSMGAERLVERRSGHCPHSISRTGANSSVSYTQSREL